MLGGPVATYNEAVTEDFSDLTEPLRRPSSVALHAHALVHDADQEALAEGADRAHRCGATALVDHALEELRLAGARPRRITQTGRDTLTPAELRVVELAGARRLARPDSSWAARFYGPEKLARAGARFAHRPDAGPR
jgi:hypothetical protein